MSRPTGTPREPDTMWTSSHLFYHQDRDRLLCGLVAPLAGEVLDDGVGDQVFFLRYSLGGPHVRLRIRHERDLDREIGERTGERAHAFFREYPSTETVSSEDIARENAAILASSPLEEDDSVYPDNHLEMIEFVPEVKRYGGSALLPRTFEMFDASSLAALQLLLDVQGGSRPSQIAHFLRFLFCQALGSARDFAEIEHWAVYADFFWPRIPAIVDAADRVFDQQGAVLADLIETEFREPSFPLVVAASRRLADSIVAIDPAVRRRILASHLHMTANRLGVKNRDEMYLCRLLERAWALAGPRLDGEIALDAGRDVEPLRRQAVGRLAGLAATRS